MIQSQFFSQLGMPSVTSARRSPGWARFFLPSLLSLGCLTESSILKKVDSFFRVETETLSAPTLSWSCLW